MSESLTPHHVTLSHVIDDYEKIRTAGLRPALRIDTVIYSLRHAIENGRTEAALDLLETIDRANRETIKSLRQTPSRTI